MFLNQLSWSNILWINSSTDFQPMVHVYTPWKHQKASGFLMFSGSIEIEHRLKMGKEICSLWFYLELVTSRDVMLLLCLIILYYNNNLIIEVKIS